MKLSDFGIFASRLQINNDTLKEFEDSLRYLRSRKIPLNQEQDEYCREKLNNVIRPIVDNLNGNLSNTMLLDDRNIVEILRRRKVKNWPTFKDNFIIIAKKISSKNLELNESEISILNDVADAMELECSKLFRRMGRFL